MSRDLVVNGVTYKYPNDGELPGWGEAASDWADAVTTLLNSLFSSTDIAQTSFTIANNQSSAANITGLSFDPASVRAAFIEYSVYRSTDSVEVVEAGKIYIAYKTTAAAWSLTREYTGESNLVITITAGGQFQYTSDDQSGASYSGTMKFKAGSITI